MKKTLISLLLTTGLFITPVLAEHHNATDAHTEKADKKTHSCSCHGKNAKKIAYKLGNLSISDAFMRPTASANMPTAAYVTINNNGYMYDRLIGVQSDIASSVELHDTKIDDKGVMSMTPLNKGVIIPASKQIEFKPRGLHIMLMNLAEPLTKGASIPLKLIFEKSGTRMISFKVADNIAHQCKHKDTKGIKTTKDTKNTDKPAKN